MQRFFFHLFDDFDFPDEEGLLLRNREEALAKARIAATELACEEVKSGKLSLDHRVVVSDEAGRVVGTVAFKDVVRVQGAGHA